MMKTLPIVTGAEKQMAHSSFKAAWNSLFRISRISVRNMALILVAFVFSASVSGQSCPGGPTTQGVTICKGGSGTISATNNCAESAVITTANRFPATGTSSNVSGTAAWTNPGNITANDASSATSTFTSSSTSQILVASNFGFTLPTDAIIKGIQVTVAKTASNTNTFYDSVVRLNKSLSAVGSNLKSASVWANSEQAVAYGSTTNLWGTTWTASDINSSGFGVSLLVRSASASSRTASVNYITVTVSYSIPGKIYWYTASSGGTLLDSTSALNPVGIAGSGLANTNMPGTYKFYAACSTTPNCRTETNFVILDSTKISTEPTAGAICAGGSTNLSVTASSSNLTYQWYKDNAIVAANETSSTLAVSEIGNYKVVVSGDCGSVTSIEVAVTLKANTAITGQPTASSSICPGASAALSVTASGAGTLLYQWYKDSIAISGATSATYSATQAGTYYVRVTGDCGSVNSANAVVALKALTTITTEPVTSKLCSDSSLTLTVAATGDGTLSYQWYKDNTSVGTDASSLLVTGIGNYYVVVTGGCYKDTSATAAITQKAATTITLQPTNGKICSDSTALIAVTATGEGTLDYQWYYNTAAISGATSRTYSVNDLGDYYVTVKGACGSVTSNTVTYTQKNPTVISVHPLASNVICPGTAATLSVTAVGEGTLKYQWYRGVSAISGATASTYSATLEGAYSMKVTGECGSVTSTSAFVSFKAVTIITSEPANAKLCADSSLTLSVAATGDGALSYQWYNGADPVGTNSASLLVNSTGNYFVIVTGGCYTDTSRTAVISANSPTTISQEPVSGKNCGDGYTLTVTASGEGTLVYQWYKDGQAISGANVSSYKATEAGDYHVTVSGQCGTVTSSTATVTIATLTSVTLQPVTQTVTCPGVSTTLTASGTGEGTVQYQWYNGSSPINGATESSYVAQQEGTYKVAVQAECGTVYSNTASLVFKKQTAIISQPKYNAICADGSATLFVKTEGVGLNYQWLLNGTMIAGATDSVYTTSVAGSYKVEVNGDCGSITSDTATVRIMPSTSITTQPQGGVICQGYSLKLEVNATGEDLSYQWKRNGTNISGATSASYNAFATGEYAVVVSGNCGTLTSASANVSVTKTTAITTQPVASSAICPGSTVQLSVVVEGSGLSYQWYKNNVIVSSETASTILVGDTGTYHVVISGDCGTATSSNAIVRAKTTTSITAQPQSIEICPSTTTTLSVSAVGEGLTYQWRKDDVIIPNAVSASYITSAAGSYTVFVSGDCEAYMSDAAIVTVKTATSIASQPQGGAICSGQTISLSVTASGQGILTYQWKKGSAVIANATSSTYEATDAGSYTVVVSGECGIVTSSAAVVSFNTPTSVISQPTAKNITYGENTSFSALGAGSGVVSYTWQVKTVNGSWTDIQAGGIYISPTSATLNVSVPGVSNSGNLYRCMISGACGDIYTDEVALTVNKAVLTVRAQNKTKVYGDPVPALTDTISGFKNSETLTTPGVLTGSALLSSSVSELSNVSTYAITAGPGDLAADNYSFNFVNGTLTVTPATLTVSADTLSRTYGSSNPALTYTITGYVGGQNYGVSSGVSGAPSLTTTATNTSFANTYPITLTKNTLSATNYSFNLLNGTLTVNKAVLTVKASNKTRNYGVADSAYTVTYTGFLLSDGYGTAGGANGTPAFTSANSPKADAGTYDIVPSQGTLTSPNYSFSFANGTLTVFKVTLTVKPNNKSRIYGSTDTTITPSYTGFANNETFETSGITGTPGFTAPVTLKSSPGTYTITANQGTLSGNNYFFSFSTGTLTITKAPLSVNADSATKVYGATLPALTISYVGFMNGESLSSGSDVTGSASVTTSATARSGAGNYPITFSTTDIGLC